MFRHQARWDRKLPADPEREWEHAQVCALFSAGRITPLRFKAAGAICVVSQVHYRWTERRGKALLYFFSVSDNRDTYRLCLDSEMMSWKIAPLQ